MYKLPIKESDFLSLKSAKGLPVTSSYSTDRNDLLSQLEELEKKYNPGGDGDIGFDVDFPELDFDKIKVEDLTDEKAKELANAELTEKQRKEKESLNESIKNIYDDLSGKKDSYLDQSEKQKQSIESEYLNRKDSAEKDALKRGLGRSSIISEKIENFDKNKINDVLNLQKSTQNTVNQIESDLQGLETKRQEALKNFDISHAIELTLKIDSLKKENEKQKQDALKYNNDLAEKEAKYYKSVEEALLKKAQDDYNRKQDAIKNGTNPNDTANKQKNEEKMALVKGYFDKIPPKEALNEFLSDISMKPILDDYYSYMHSYLRSRVK